MRLSRRFVLVPKLVTELTTYDRGQFGRDEINGPFFFGAAGSPVLAEIGENDLFTDLDQALGCARQLVGAPRSVA